MADGEPRWRVRIETGAESAGSWLWLHGLVPHPYLLFGVVLWLDILLATPALVDGPELDPLGGGAVVGRAGGGPTHPGGIHIELHNNFNRWQ